MAASWQQLFEAANRAFAGGLYEAAEQKYLEALDFAREAGDQSWVGDSLRGLAKIYMLLDRPNDAEQAAAEAEQVDRLYWGYESQQVADDMYLLAEAKRTGRNLDEARAIFDRTLEARLGLFGENHDDILAVLIRLLWIDLEEGDSHGMLISHMRQANEVFARLHPYGGFAKALNVPSLLKPYIDQEMPSEATMIAERLQKAMRTVLGNSHPEITLVLADCSSIMQVANNQLSAWRLKNRSEAMSKTTSADHWLTQLDANKVTGSESGAGGTGNPKSNVGNNFPQTQASAPPPINPHPLANPYPPSNPFASGPSTAPANPSSQLNPFPPPNPFASPSSGPPANPNAPPNAFASASLSPSANTNAPAKPLAAAQSYEPASSVAPTIGQPKIELPAPTKGGASLKAAPVLERRVFLDAVLARAGIDMDSWHFALWWLGMAEVLGGVSALIYRQSGFGQLVCQAFMLGFVVVSIGLSLFLWAAVNRHQQQVAKNLPDALEIMVSELQQGVSVAESLAFLSLNAPPSIRREFARTVAALKSGRPLKEAVDEMAYYVRTLEMSQLVDRIKIGHSAGAGLAAELAALARSFREKQSLSSYGKSVQGGRTICLIVGGCFVWLSALPMVFLPAVGAATLNSLPALILLMMAFGFALAVALVLVGPKGDKSLGASAQRAAERLFKGQSRGKMANDLRRELSNFLDLVVMYVESGVSLPQAVQQVSKNAAGSCPILCRELHRSLNELTSFRAAIPNAFRQIGKQYEVEELVQLGGTLEAAERTKSSVAYQLREQSKALKNHLKYRSTARGAGGLAVILFCLYMLAFMCGFIHH